MKQIKIIILIFLSLILCSCSEKQELLLYTIAVDESPITLKAGETIYPPNCIVTDSIGSESNCKMTSNVNIHQEGEYTLTFFSEFEQSVSKNISVTITENIIEVFDYTERDYYNIDSIGANFDTYNHFHYEKYYAKNDIDIFYYCPDNWDYVEDFEAKKRCINNSNGFTRVDDEVKLTKINTDYIRWENVLSEDIITMVYKSNILAPQTTMKMFYNDILFLFNNEGNLELTIDRFDHYHRNDFQIVFPKYLNDLTETKKLFRNIYTIDDTEYTCNVLGVNLLGIDGGYFHRIGENNEDNSNLDTTKIVCQDPLSNHSYEAVYDGNYLDESSIVMGTYNYYDSGISITNHYLYDVYPYLIWGNTALDPTTIIERFAHDYLSHKILYLNVVNSPAVYRGEALLNLFISEFSSDDYDVESFLELLEDWSNKLH